MTTAAPDNDTPRSTILPLGPQTLPLPPEVAAAVVGLAELPAGSLIAERVWLERRGKQILLHVGHVTLTRPLEVDTNERHTSTH